MKHADTIYKVRGLKYESNEVYPELGDLKWRTIDYASGREEDIRARYEGQGFMDISLEPVQIRYVSRREVAA